MVWVHGGCKKKMPSRVCPVARLFFVFRGVVGCAEKNYYLIICVWGYMCSRLCSQLQRERFESVCRYGIERNMMTSQALTCRDYESGVLSQCRLLVKCNPLTCTFFLVQYAAALHKRETSIVASLIVVSLTTPRKTKQPNFTRLLCSFCLC